MDRKLMDSSSGIKFNVDKKKLGGGYSITLVRRRVQHQAPNIHTLMADDKAAGKNARCDPGKLGLEVCSDSNKTEATQDFKKHKTKTVGQQASLKGQVVITRDGNDGIYYEGVVTSTPTPCCAIVKRFFDGMISTTNTRFLLPVRGAISYPPLRSGDHVLVQVLNLNNSRESYIPGMIQMSSISAGICLSTVILYNRQTIVTARRYIVKISKERFDFTVDHICRALPQDSESHGKKRLGEEKFEVYRRYDQHGGNGGKQSEDERTDKKGHSSKKLYSKKCEKRKKDQCHISVNERLSSELEEGKMSDTLEGGNMSDSSQMPDKSIETWSNERKKKETNQESSGEDGKKTCATESDAMFLRAQLSEQGEVLRQLQTELQEQSHKHRRRQEAMKKKLKVLKKDHRHEKSTENKRRDETMKPPYKRETAEDVEKDDSSVTLALLEMRKSLPQMKEEEEVLARWSDEGWYYRCVIKANCEDFSYLLMDSTGDMQQTWREDILTETDDNYENLMIEDKVVALHPDYSFIYAPALVTAIFSDFTIQVLFYNNVIAELHRSELYKIPDFKYIHDVKELEKKENLWKGQPVVTRQDGSGVYQIGCVLERVEDKHIFLIRWHDGTMCEQQPQHMFGAFTRRHKATVGDRILGVQKRESYTYLPGNVIDDEDGKLRVNFCDGSQGVVQQDECYWLSDTYFDEAVQYFNNINSQVLHQDDKNVFLRN